MTQTMNTKPVEKWHQLAEQNVALAKSIMYEYRWLPMRYKFIEVQDVISEALLALCKAAKKYIESGDPRDFQTYAFTAIKNALLSMTRDRLRAKRVCKDQLPSGFDCDTVLDNTQEDERATVENKQYCNHLINKSTMSSAEKMILELYYWQGMTYREIAESLGIDINEVGYHLQSAKKSIKEAATTCIK